LLSAINFSPTRYFPVSEIALYSAIPGLIYCAWKYKSPILYTLIALFCSTAFAWYHTSFNIRQLMIGGSQIQLLSSASIWLLSFVAMKMALKDDVFCKSNGLKYFFYLFAIVGFVLFVRILMRGTEDKGSNAVYYILPVVPFLINYSKRKTLIFSIVFILSLISLKRSAAIIVALSMLWIFFCSRKKIINIAGIFSKLIVIGALAIFLLFGFLASRMDSLQDRLLSIADDGGSHRDLIYAYAWSIIDNTDNFHRFVGYGPRFFWYIDDNIQAAHNDFLEIAISCGIIGEALFLLLHVFLIRLLYKAVKYKLDLALPLGICYICFLIWNLVGCQFAFQSTTVCTCMFWALAENKIKEYENTIYCHQRFHFRRSNECRIKKN